LQRIAIKIPLLKRFFIHSSLARFAKTLSVLLDGGLPLVQAMGFAKEALRNARLEEIVQHVEAKIIEGNSMSASFSRFQEIPPLFSRMIGIGEESGQLAPLLSQIATIYEEETERTLNRLVTLAQPILLLLMGVLIGGILLSILLPLSDFGSTLNTSSFS
jgi:general secretion pathway protein F/type IV pilus assembly protein PilC